MKKLICKIIGWFDNLSIEDEPYDGEDIFNYLVRQEMRRIMKERETR